MPCCNRSPHSFELLATSVCRVESKAVIRPAFATIAVEQRAMPALQTTRFTGFLLVRS